MMSLSPAKLLVILVIALIVLGPEKLPQVARQIGAAWHDLRKWRSRIESEVRSTFPDLPPTHEVAEAVRSPLAFLDRLADEHERTWRQEQAHDSADPAESDPAGPPPAPDPTAAGPPANGTPANGAAATGPATNGSVRHNGSLGHNGSHSQGEPGESAAQGVGTGGPGAFPAVPDDPSMN